MRTIKIKRDMWNTPHHSYGPACFLLNWLHCGCIMGLIGEACGLPRGVLLNHGVLYEAELLQIGMSELAQDRAIEINDDSAISDDYRETKLKELFKDHFVLEFV